MISFFTALMALVSFRVTPPTEIPWHPVEQLVASLERVQLVTAEQERTQTSVVVITGLVPTKWQLTTVKEAMRNSKVKAEPRVEAIDFTVERQELGIGTSGAKSPVWTTLSLKDAMSVLEESASEQADDVGPTQINPVFTMPLPNIVGKWPKSVTHPKLTFDHQLFRFMDFTGKPGHHYRYRVRFEYINPYYETNSDPFLSAGESRFTEWSVPTPTVTFAASP